MKTEATNMQEQLVKFIKEYANLNELTEQTVSMFAGALLKDSLETTDHYKKFIVTLGNAAPQLLQYAEMINKGAKK